MAEDPRTLWTEGSRTLQFNAPGVPRLNGRSLEKVIAHGAASAGTSPLDIPMATVPLADPLAGHLGKRRSTQIPPASGRRMADGSGRSSVRSPKCRDESLPDDGHGGIEDPRRPEVLSPIKKAGPAVWPFELGLNGGRPGKPASVGSCCHLALLLELRQCCAFLYTPSKIKAKLPSSSRKAQMPMRFGMIQEGLLAIYGVTHDRERSSKRGRWHSGPVGLFQTLGQALVDRLEPPGRTGAEWPYHGFGFPLHRDCADGAGHRTGQAIHRSKC